MGTANIGCPKYDYHCPYQRLKAHRPQRTLSNFEVMSYSNKRSRPRPRRTSWNRNTHYSQGPSSLRTTPSSTPRLCRNCERPRLLPTVLRPSGSASTSARLSLYGARYAQIPLVRLVSPFLSPLGIWPRFSLKLPSARRYSKFRSSACHACINGNHFSGPRVLSGS